MKKYFSLSVFATLFAFTAASFWILAAAEERLALAQSKHKKISEIDRLLHKNQSYLQTHNASDFSFDKASLKSELEKIAALSDVGEMQISEKFEAKNRINLEIKLSAESEKSIYKFLYFTENILSGIVSVNYLGLGNSDNKFIAKIIIQITESDIKIDPFSKTLNHDDEGIKNEMENIDMYCDFSIFKKKKNLNHKLSGIINDCAFVNNLMFKVGDRIGNYIIKTIDRDNIKIKSDKGHEKIIDLGQSF